MGKLFDNYLVQRISFTYRRLKKDSFFTICIKVISKLLSLVIGVVFLPVAILLVFFDYRVVTVFTDRVGHLAIEPDCLLKAVRLGIIPKKRYIILAPSGRVANEQLLKYWEPHFVVIRSRIATFFMRSLSMLGLARYDVGHFMRNLGRDQGAYPIYSAWGERDPILSLTEEDRVWGDSQLAALGVPEGSWFICIHAREGGFSPIDEELQSYRNCDIKNYLLAAREIIKRGGYVIRIGDPTSKQLKPEDGIIDYAHSLFRSSRMDLILCAKAKFILGNTSGIFLVGSAFGTPSACSNFVPQSNLCPLLGDLSIPKLHWSIDEERYLSFEELMNSDLSNAVYAKFYQDAKTRLDENEEEDVRDLAVEMFERLDGTFVENKEDMRLQAEYAALFKTHHYAYGAAGKVGTKFLRKYQHLLACR